MPDLPLLYLGQGKAHVLVGGTEPKHPGKHLLGLMQAAVAVEAAEEGAIADPLPGEETVEVLADTGHRLPDEFSDLDVLTPYATFFRYEDIPSETVEAAKTS